jgi:hypothetical protein
MPKTGAQNVPHVAWTDHRIRRKPDRQELVLTSPDQNRAQIDELVSVLSSDGSMRDLALAYFDLAVGGVR